MLLSPRKNGLTSLFKEVRVLKVQGVHLHFAYAGFTAASGPFQRAISIPFKRVEDGFLSMT